MASSAVWLNYEFIVYDPGAALAWNIWPIHFCPSGPNPSYIAPTSGSQYLTVMNVGGSKINVRKGVILNGR